MDATSLGIIVACVICAVAGSLIGQAKEASTPGMFLGLFLGPLGVLVAAFIDCRSQCPQCRGRINNGASACPHCRIAVRQTDDGFVRNTGRPKEKSFWGSAPGWGGSDNDDPQDVKDGTKAAKDDLPDNNVLDWLKK